MINIALILSGSIQYSLVTAFTAPCRKLKQTAPDRPTGREYREYRELPTPTRNLSRSAAEWGPAYSCLQLLTGPS